MAAYEDLVRCYQQIAFRTAYVMTGDAEAAKDAAQSGFIKAYYALDRFRTGAPFRPWLLKIVANEARNQARSAHRRSEYELASLSGDRHIERGLPGAGGRPRDDAAPSPEEVALGALTREALLVAVSRLPETDRQAIVLRYFLDFSEAEMAGALGCMRGTVKSRLSRAVGRLRENLASNSAGIIGAELGHE